MRSLFLQENLIKDIEGLDNLKELVVLNLNDNIIEKVSGLGNCPAIQTCYLKRNKLGRNTAGNLESLRGLLECPTITCLDISENYLTDPEILPEILQKMPNLACLYSQGNDFQKKISSYRKTIIAKMPNLKFVDDRPVFEDDRRRAEAWLRGGMDEERLEMKLIKKEKEAKHWANHDAFLLMVKNAREEKKAEEASKEDKKASMKDMMAAAKAEKTAATVAADAGKAAVAAKTKEGEEGIFKCPEDIKETEKFVAGMEKKFEQREHELLNDLEHAETVDDNVLEPSAE